MHGCLKCNNLEDCSRDHWGSHSCNVNYILLQIKHIKNYTGLSYNDLTMCTHFLTIYYLQCSAHFSTYCHSTLLGCDIDCGDSCGDNCVNDFNLLHEE